MHVEKRDLRDPYMHNHFDGIFFLTLSVHKELLHNLNPLNEIGDEENPWHWL